MTYYNNQTENQKKIRNSILPRYFLSGESKLEHIFDRVSSTYATNTGHRLRLNLYLNKGWFLPATPILANAGRSKGLPISCFLNEMEDNFDDIVDTKRENEYLTSLGGGIGTNFSNIREKGCNIQDKGKTGGVIPIIKASHEAVDWVMQAGTRRGALASYLHISHPEILEFLHIRKKGGESKRKLIGYTSAHHGIVISDDFMNAVKEDKEWSFSSSNRKIARQQIKARELWQEILITRLETGESYIIFEDNVNNAIPLSYKKLGLKVNTSNLCSEIMLHTGKDYNDRKRTAVCCLSSLNLYTFDEWKEEKDFIYDVLEFLDNVLQSFIDNAPNEISNAKYSALMERSIGLGVMGFHSYLQRHLVPIESEGAIDQNNAIFYHIYNKSKEANLKLSVKRGDNPDFQKCGIQGRFSHILAIAPTATISKIAGQVSQGIEPSYSPVYLGTAGEGKSLTIEPAFNDLLDKKGIEGEDRENIVNLIVANDGNLSKINLIRGNAIFTKEEIQTFKPWKDISQFALIKLVSDRQRYICQSQSFNLLLDPKISKQELHKIHWEAWKQGVKSLYYCRSYSTSDFGNKECEACQ